MLTECGVPYHLSYLLEFGGKFNTLGNFSLELLLGGSDQVVLKVIHGTKTQVLLNGTVLREEHGGGEVLDVDTVNVVGGDVGTLDNLLAVHGADDAIGEACCRVCHGEGGRTTASLSLDNFGARILNALGKGADGIGVEVVNDALGHQLGEDGNDGDAGVSTYDGHVHVDGVLIAQGGDELVGAHNVQSGHTIDLISGDTLFLENFARNWDGRVDGVGDDADDGVGGGAGTGACKGGNNGGIGVEQIVTCHTWFAGDTGGNEDNVAPGNGCFHIITNKGGDLCAGVDVAEIGADAGRDGVYIIARDARHRLVALEKKGKRLSNATSGSKNGDFLLDRDGGGKGAGDTR